MHGWTLTPVETPKGGENAAVSRCLAVSGDGTEKTVVVKRFATDVAELLTESAAERLIVCEDLGAGSRLSTVTNGPLAHRWGDDPLDLAPAFANRQEAFA